MMVHAECRMHEGCRYERRDTQLVKIALECYEEEGRWGMSGRVMIEGMRTSKVCLFVKICKGIVCKGLKFGIGGVWMGLDDAWDWRIESGEWYQNTGCSVVWD
jgi:hypothetical protein